MSDSVLWYIRQQGGLAKGPFSAASINNNVSLRRLKITDEVSEDQITWQPLSSWPELQTAYSEEVASRLDERDGFDRRNKHSPPQTTKQRRTSDRRRFEHDEIIRRRQLRTQLMQKFRQRKQALFWPLFTMIMLGLLILCYGIFYAQSFPSTNAMCHQAAAPYVNWENCIKPEASLENKDLSYALLRNSQLFKSNLMNTLFTGADLSYADLHESNLTYSQLQNANLKGANFAGADLSYADLHNSDLSYANLNRANLGNSNLTNARFDHAIWVNGKICKPPSIGHCQ